MNSRTQKNFSPDDVNAEKCSRVKTGDDFRKSRSL